jgi:hypothetical protein
VDAFRLEGAEMVEARRYGWRRSFHCRRQHTELPWVARDTNIESMSRSNESG